MLHYIPREETEMTAGDVVKKLHEMEANAKSDDENKRKKAVDDLKECIPARIIEGVSQSDILRKFAESNPDIQKAWSASLLVRNCPDIPVKGKEKEDVISISQQYLSDYYFCLYLQIKRADANANKKSEYLDRSSNLGSYHAMVIRTKVNYEELVSASLKLKDEEKENRISEIMGDADRLANFYGSIGYVRAGNALFKLADYFLERKIHKNDKNRGKTFYEQAIKNYICGSLLEDDAYSNHLIDVLTHKQGIVSVFKEGTIKFDNWKVACAQFQSWVGTDTYKVLFDQAKKEISQQPTKSFKS